MTDVEQDRAQEILRRAEEECERPRPTEGRPDPSSKPKLMQVSLFPSLWPDEPGLPKPDEWLEAMNPIPKPTISYENDLFPIGQ